MLLARSLRTARLPWRIVTAHAAAPSCCQGPGLAASSSQRAMATAPAAAAAAAAAGAAGVCACVGAHGCRGPPPCGACGPAQPHACCARGCALVGWRCAVWPAPSTHAIDTSCSSSPAQTHAMFPRCSAAALSPAPQARRSRRRRRRQRPRHHCSSPHLRTCWLLRRTATTASSSVQSSCRQTRRHLRRRCSSRCRSVWLVATWCRAAHLPHRGGSLAAIRPR
jgi:hypothetical protein